MMMSAHHEKEIWMKWNRVWNSINNNNRLDVGKIPMKTAKSTYLEMSVQKTLNPSWTSSTQILILLLHHHLNISQTEWFLHHITPMWIASMKPLLDRMKGDIKTYYSVDQIIHESGADDHSNLLVTREFLRSMQSTSLPPGEVRIKIDCPLILLQNLSPSISLCNGTCMIIVGMSEHVLQVQLIEGDHNGQLTLIPCISFIPTSTPDYTFKIMLLFLLLHTLFHLISNSYLWCIDHIYVCYCLYLPI